MAWQVGMAYNGLSSVGERTTAFSLAPNYDFGTL